VRGERSDMTHPTLPFLAGGRMPPTSTSGTSQTLALCRSAQGKSGRMPELSVKPASRSRLPVSTRWTFTSALPAAVHCTSASLRHPGFACFRSSLVGTGSPSLVLRFSGEGVRKHDARAFRKASPDPATGCRPWAPDGWWKPWLSTIPSKESRAGCPSFP
jgi:hypothetical protein